jgi:hypothetical protein
MATKSHRDQAKEILLEAKMVLKVLEGTVEQSRHDLIEMEALVERARRAVKEMEALIESAGAD